MTLLALPNNSLRGTSPITRESVVQSISKCSPPKIKDNKNYHLKNKSKPIKKLQTIFKNNK